ncbi:hypothetical protein XcodCFBP4690_09975 [Xanthomonas codiaei]|uniref:Uncharacterized protein n=1 Tax=Xanthomonas codiaei TaxID=56463 RepID=A0A2S7CRK1_9XANT|nr:hypothetical protein XcodCFBP4690_09975 [Xanthomonas codiaei]
MGIGDWGVGSGEWGVGSGEWGVGSGEWGVGSRIWIIGLRQACSGGDVAGKQCPPLPRRAAVPVAMPRQTAAAKLRACSPPHR